MGFWRFRRNRRAEKSRAVFFTGELIEQDSEGFFAVTVNISDCGACILTDRPVEEGEVFILESSMWSKAREARTVWSRTIGEALFEVGLSLSAEPGR